MALPDDLCWLTEIKCERYRYRCSYLLFFLTKIVVCKIFNMLTVIKKKLIPVCVGFLIL